MTKTDLPGFPELWVDPTDSSELPDTAVRSANYSTGELISLRDLHEDEPLREIKNLGSMSLAHWWAAASVARVLVQTRSSGGSIMQEETLDLDLGSC